MSATRIYNNILHVYNALRFSVSKYVMSFQECYRNGWLHFIHGKTEVERGNGTHLRLRDSNLSVPAPRATFSRSIFTPAQNPNTLTQWRRPPRSASPDHPSLPYYWLPYSCNRGTEAGGLGPGAAGSRKSKVRLHLPFLSQCKLGWHWE